MEKGEVFFKASDDMVQKKFQAVVLAAGRSSRMGVPKISLRMQNGQYFVEAITEAFLKFGCTEVVVVVSQQAYEWFMKQGPAFKPGVRLIQNDSPSLGRFYSFQTGVKALAHHDHVFLHNADNPFVAQHALQAMVHEAGTADYLCPSFDQKHGHPVLLSAGLVQDVRRLKPPYPHLRDFLNRYGKKSVPVNDPGVLVNINTPEEFSSLGNQ